MKDSESQIYNAALECLKDIRSIIVEDKKDRHLDDTDTISSIVIRLNEFDKFRNTINNQKCIKFQSIDSCDRILRKGG